MNCNRPQNHLPIIWPMQGVSGLWKAWRTKTFCWRTSSCFRWSIASVEHLKGLYEGIMVAKVFSTCNCRFLMRTLSSLSSKFGFTNAHILGIFSYYETRVCDCVLHQLRCNDCSKRIWAPVTQTCVLVDPILCWQWKKKYLRNLLLHICDFRVHMQIKYIQLQIYCDFSVRIQNLQLEVLKTFATIIPS